MKRFLSWLLCLCLVFSCVGAVAEEATQAVLAQAFKNKVQEFLSRVVTPGNSLTYTVEAQGVEGKEVLTPLTDEEGNQIMDLTVTVPGLEGPVQIQSNDQVIWAAYQGQAFELRLADLNGILQAVLSSFSVPQVDPEVLSELVQLFLMDVVMPGITVEQGENNLSIRVALTAKDALQGVAQFVDQVLATERYWGAIKPLINTIAKQQQYTGDFAADFEQNWPQLKEQLLAVETDVALNGSLVIATPAETGTTAVLGKLAVTANEQTVSVTLAAADTDRETEVHLGANLGETTLALLDLTVAKAAKTLTAELSVPQSQTNVKLTAAVTDQGLQCHVAAFARSALVLNADVTVLTAKDGFTATAQITYNRQTVSANLFWSKYLKTLTVNSAGGTFKAELRTEADGHFSALVSLPQYQGDFRLEGILTANSLRAELTYQNPRMARVQLSAEVNAVWANGEVTANATVNVASRATYAFQLFWSRSAKSLSYQSAEDVLSLNVLQDEKNAVTLARLAYSPVARGKTGWEITYTPDALVYADNMQTVTATAAYLSETQHQIDVAVQAAGQEGEMHLDLNTVLAEDENGWSITCTLETMGQTQLKAALVSAPVEGEIALLSTQQPVRITPELVQQILQQLLASQMQPGMTAPTQEAPVEEDSYEEAPAA